MGIGSPLTVDADRRLRIEDTPVVTFRSPRQYLELLDGLAKLEGESRSKIINKAILQYGLDYFGARGRTPEGYLGTRLRMIKLLRKRIEVNMNLKENRDLGNFEQDRRQILEEACRYARYSKNQAPLLLLSKISGWLAATFEDPLPADMKARTYELQALLEASVETHHTEEEAAVKNQPQH